MFISIANYIYSHFETETSKKKNQDIEQSYFKDIHKNNKIWH